MKLFTLLPLLLISIEACAQKDISWQSNGKVTIDSNTIKLKMQNVYYGYKINNGVYVIGFEIDKQGNNTPTLAWLSSTDNTHKYWSFDNILQEVFMLNDQAHLLDMNGEIYKLENQLWKKSELKLKEKSRLIDTEYGILACYPSPVFKSPPGIGGCYSVNNKWEIKANWRDTVPKICNGHVIVLDQEKKTLWLKKYSKSSGKLLASRKIKKIPDDLCLIDFP